MLLTSILFACSEPTDPIELEMIEDYYPLEVDNYWKYKVDSITYIDFQRDTTTSYSYEQIVDEYEQNGNTVFLVEEHYSDSLDGNFTYFKTFTVRLEENQIIKTYDNLPFISLVNPILQGPLHAWDGNSLFSTDSIFLEIGSKNVRLYEDWNYFYSNIDTSLTLAGTPFDQVIVVEQVDFQTFIDFYRAEEAYAKNVGLIKKSMAILQNGQDTTNYTDANYGIVVEKTLLDYGK